MRAILLLSFIFGFYMVMKVCSQLDYKPATVINIAIVSKDPDAGENIGQVGF